MIYCQDCGAANDVAGTFCRICGRNLSPERGSLLCPTCSQPLVNQATFCSSCGIAVLQAPAAQPAHNFAFAGAAADGGGALPAPPPLNPVIQVINESLELPDWLKRAATEQPQDSSQATDGSFMYTGVNPTPLQPPVPAPPVEQSTPQIADPGVPQSLGAQMQPAAPWPTQATPPQGGTNWSQAPAAQPEPTSIASAPSAPRNSIWPSQVKPTMSSAAPASPLEQAPTDSPAASGQGRRLVSPEIPNGGLDQSMPSWLNQPPQAVAPVAPPTPPIAAAAPTDTTSFISESDLPAWIRQLAEAEEQRKQEEATAAAAAAASYQPAPPEVSPPTQDLFGEGSLARRISQLPGEAEPPQVNSNPWLTRRDELSGPEDAQADVWSRPKSGGDRVLGEKVFESQTSFAPSAGLQSDQTMIAQESAPVETPDDAKLRLALLIAAAISVAALAAYLFMTGGL